MRIGILTFHRAINYGAFLQAYSLVSRIQQDFPSDSVEIIDYNAPAREWFIFKCPIVFLYRRSIQEGIQKYKQTRTFKKALKSLHLKKKLIGYRLKDVEKYISAHFDVVIVGSDAVFNWNDLGLPNVYFLANTTCTKVSYAASSHLQQFDAVSAEGRQYLQNALNQFSYIGVRDDSTARFVEDFSSLVPKHNCDPSVFLKMDYSEGDLRKKLTQHGFSFNKPTVFIMLMHAEHGELVRKYFDCSYQIVALMDGNSAADKYLYDLDPFEWSHVFKYGSVLVTDYFHGTIFGLKNGIPVMSIDDSGYSDNKHGYESKAKDLLVKRLDQSFMYVNGACLNGANGYEHFKNQMDIILKSFDKSTIEKRLNKEASSFEAFEDDLRSILNSKKDC